MAAKKSKNFLNRELSPSTESVALGSAFSVLFLVLIKSLIIALPVGLLVAFAHNHARTKKANSDKKTKNKKKK